MMTLISILLRLWDITPSNSSLILLDYSNSVAWFRVCS